ncbi:MAG: hypothetical protein MUF29_06155, partial [Chitinophagaceae bacterium]|nr:hypothetical protein [Chitinophagaceae bacterium]
MADNNDPLNIKVGNPGLVQAFNHRIGLNYNFYQVLTNRGLWMSLSFNPVSNAFSTRDVVDPFGRRVSQTVNVNGNYTAYGYISYNFKWNKADLGVDLSMNPQLSRFTNFINGEENSTSSRNLGFSASINKYKEKKYSFYLSQGATYNYSASSIRPELTTRYWTARTGFDGSVDLPLNIVIRSDFSYNWRQTTDVFTDNNNAFIWN